MSDLKRIHMWPIPTTHVPKLLESFLDFEHGAHSVAILTLVMNSFFEAVKRLTTGNVSLSHKCPFKEYATLFR